MANKKALTQAQHFKTSNNFLNIINKAFENKQEFYTFVDKIREGHGEGCFSESIEQYVMDSINDKKVLNLVNAFEKIQKTQRQTLGINDHKDVENKSIKEKEIEHKHWIEKQRLELQKAEFEYKKWLEKEKLKKDDVDVDEEDDGFVEALGIATEEIWKDVEDEEKEE